MCVSLGRTMEGYLFYLKWPQWTKLETTEGKMKSTGNRTKASAVDYTSFSRMFFCYCQLLRDNFTSKNFQFQKYLIINMKSCVSKT